MKQMLITLVLMTAMISIVSAGDSTEENSVSISGTVRFSGTGDIYIFLVDKAMFKKRLTGIKKTVIRLTSEALKSGRVSFRFNGLSPGVYGIRGYQDTNGNGTLDSGLFGPTEPWGMSFKKGTQSFGRPRFDAIAIEAMKPVNGVQITME